MRIKLFICMALSFIIAAFTNINVLIVIAGSAVVGIVASLITERKEKQK